MTTFAVPGESINEKESGDTEDHPLGWWIISFSEADELPWLAVDMDILVTAYGGGKKKFLTGEAIAENKYS